MANTATAVPPMANFWVNEGLCGLDVGVFFVMFQVLSTGKSNNCRRYSSARRTMTNVDRLVA